MIALQGNARSRLRGVVSLASWVLIAVGVYNYAPDATPLAVGVLMWIDCWRAGP